MSIKQTEKICCNCGKSSLIFSRGRCETCARIQDYKPLIRTTPLSKSNYIKMESKTQKKRYKRYKLLRDEFLDEYDICHVCNIAHSSEVHHRAGRDGANLFRYFLAVCRKCHRMIEDNPKLAKEQGWTITRLNKENEGNIDSD